MPAPTTRREFLRGSLGALGALTVPAVAAAAADRRPHAAPRAKRVIYLGQLGAPSQLDLFDPKPELARRDGEEMPASLVAGQAVDQIRGRRLVIAASRFAFRRHGASGIELSELLPNLGRVVDRIALVRSLHTDVLNHVPALMMAQTGHAQPGRPSMGAWISHALGTSNADLPSFVVLVSGDPPRPPAPLWGNAFLPGEHQGVRFLAGATPVPFLANPRGVDDARRRGQLDALAALNAAAAERVGDPAIDVRARAYELAHRMQATLPEAIDLGSESAETLALYGAEPGVPSYAVNCLMARRMIERGVRFVQLYHGDWDHHQQLPRRIRGLCGQVDRPSAALLVDLERRGLLEDTLVVWGGEFGRTPMQQGARGGEHAGRDHHGKAFSVWLAGGGVRAGTVVGETDELGYEIVRDPVHVHDLQATILHLLGLDHERVTHRHQGRDFRLTDVAGRVVPGLLA